MEWRTHWHGMVLIARTEGDKKLLKDLFEALPDQADSMYEDGTKGLSEETDGSLRLILDR